MEGIILVFGLILVITYLWVMSLFKKRDATLEALDAIDSFVMAQINLIQKCQEMRLLSINEDDKAAIIKLSSGLQADYDKLNFESVEQHFLDRERFEQLVQSILEEIVQNSALVQKTDLLQEVQIYHDLAESVKDAYQYYNVSVSEFNTAVNIFPGMVIAYLLRVKSLPLYPIKLDNSKR
ncbi:hypothetical protein [uncultured Shewanella sp.]|uniref:hypothetical protein n=1 Tax=uncultured Shewanella sp. TaxID=173975 RepID=UPI002611726A|nr:hypothetical protein [uncultured Shewanella sp.]